MKSPLFLLALSIITFLTPPSNVEEGLIAHYSFNRCDARDDSGNESHGILYGGISCWCGIDQQGLLLDGVDDYVEFEGKVNQVFSTSDFSISFYYKAEQYSVFPQSLVAKRVACDKFHMLDIQLDMQAQQMATHLHETSEKYYPELSPEYEGSGWHHYALVRKGIHAYTYIDGQLIRRARRCSGVDLSNEALLSLSNSPCIEGRSARRFKGIVDELRVYDRALSESAIQALYDRFPIEQPDADCAS